MPTETAALLKDDPQKVLPTLVLHAHAVRHAGALLRGAAVGHQVDRVGDACWRPVGHLRREHLASVPSGTGRPISENLLTMRHHGADLQRPAVLRVRHPPRRARRSTRLVSGAYQVPLVGAFVPLVFGPLLETGDHAGRDIVDRPGHRGVAAVPRQPARGARIPGAAGRRCWPGRGGHGRAVRSRRSGSRNVRTVRTIGSTACRRRSGPMPANASRACSRRGCANGAEVPRAPPARPGRQPYEPSGGALQAFREPASSYTFRFPSRSFPVFAPSKAWPCRIYAYKLQPACGHAQGPPCRECPTRS